MSRIIRFVALVSLLSPGVPLLMAVDCRPCQGVKVPPEPRNDAGGVPYCGKVTDVTRTSITVQYADEKPKCFAASDALAAGKCPKEPRPIPGRQQPYFVQPSMMYRLTDVVVGDWVDICYSSVDGVITCDHICIKKRPGGLVPPLPEEAEALRMRRPLAPGVPLKNPHIAYHEWTNAYWDLEDRDIAYPEKFGRDRRFPVAPLPREVKPQP